MPSSVPEISQFILKVASRCNLDCDYCYVYHKADTSWRNRPATMSDEVFESALGRIRQHCELTGQSDVRITFHGGEPCLAGVEKMRSWCARTREALDAVSTVRKVHLGIQTNGTLLNDAWGEVFLKNRVDVGISIDGPQAVHDAHRIDHMGRGSYQRVRDGLEILQRHGVRHGIMCVIPFGQEPLDVHRHFLSLGARTLTYILPNFTHDTIAPVRERYGATPCADFLIPVFDDWWFNSSLEIRIRDLWNMARIVMGGDSEIETFGNTAPLYAFVETDGEIEGLDNLYVCKDGIARMGLNVRDAAFADMLRSETMHKVAIFKGMPKPAACQYCSESATCSGGYLPHRWSGARGFDNESVWCADFLRLFGHIRERMGISVEETRSRRRALKDRAQMAPAAV
ncbi:radical SAM protein [Methylorubrum extorquens]